MRNLPKRWKNKTLPSYRTLDMVVKGLGLVAVIVAQFVTVFHMLPR
jgi:hypothetical protein